jgi:hypothetical protein
VAVADELWDRAARVTVGTLKLEGFTVKFKVKKSLKPEPNTAELDLYNLNEKHRAELEELRPREKLATKGIPCKIEAGYGDRLSLVWLGDLRTIDSVREGPDWVTHLGSGDGEKAWQNARMNLSYGPKTPVDTVLRAMVRALGVGEGNVAKVANQLRVAGAGKLLAEGAVFTGPVARHLTDFARSADLEVSIQDGAVQILDRGKALAGRALRIGANSGLIGSPTVDNEGILAFRILVMNDVRPGTLVVMDAERIKGNYRLETAEWDCDSSGGPWYIDCTAKRY